MLIMQGLLLGKFHNKLERGWSSIGRPMNETFRVQDQNGNELVASRQGIMAAQEAHGSAKMIKGLFGALAGLAALGAVTVEPNLFGKVVAPSALGFLANKLLNGSPHPQVETVEGGEIPVSTVFSKTAVQKHNLALLMGMALPAALGLDYLYNRHIKHRHHPMPEAEMGKGRRTLYNAGRKVTEKPSKKPPMPPPAATTNPCNNRNKIFIILNFTNFT